MHPILSPFLALISLLILHPAQGSTFLPLSKRQETPRDLWGLYAYSKPNCQGDVVAAWQGDDPVEVCIPFPGAAQSIAGGSGDSAETAVNLWEDGECSVAAAIEDPMGVDGNGYPCFNGVVGGFTVGPAWGVQ